MSGMYREVPMFFCSFHELIDKSKLDKVFRYRNRWKIEFKLQIYKKNLEIDSFHEEPFDVSI